MGHSREVGSKRVDGWIVPVITLESEHKPLGHPNVTVRILRQVSLHLDHQPLLVTSLGHVPTSFDQTSARVPRQCIAYLSRTIEGERSRV